jgi:hypothetical protein
MFGLTAEEFNEFVDDGQPVDNAHMANVLIRVFVGGHDSRQQDKFANAMLSTMRVWDSKSKYMPKEEYLDTDGAKQLGWGIKEIIDWLLESDIHFILNHMHQGMKGTDCRIVDPNIQRLYHHPGFPTGEELSCSIFQQDKFKYIRAIPMETIPTLQLQFESEGPPDLSVRETGEINRFMDTFDEGCGWHVKPPFTTNGEGTFF